MVFQPSHSLRKGLPAVWTPGTGRSSLSLSIVGYFGLDIYILRLSAVNDEASLRKLFANLPSRCIVLLEDIDAVSSKRSGVSLSALLNAIVGVASREGRVLIMTTNYITCLDEALLRPGREDKKIELGLADKKMTADLFYVVFKPMEDDIALPKYDQSDVTG